MQIKVYDDDGDDDENDDNDDDDDDEATEFDITTVVTNASMVTTSISTIETKTKRWCLD